MLTSSSSPEEILALVKLINQSLCSLTSGDTFASNISRCELVSAAERLVLAARSPEENLFAIAQQVITPYTFKRHRNGMVLTWHVQPAQNAALRCAIALGIPSLLPLDGSPLSTDELGLSTGAEKNLLKRLLQACASTSLIAQTSEQHYAHSAISRALISSANRDLITLMYDYNGRAIFALPEFLKSRQWQDPGTYEHCAFMFGSRTELPMWEYRDQNEDCRKVFDSGMRSEIVASLSTEKSSGPFAFGEELGHEAIEDGVTIIDLGGGRGQALEQIRADHPELKGRFVLLDLKPVIDRAIEIGLPSWIEPVVGSFFESLPIRGAQMYFIRRTLHNWGDEPCRIILRNVAAAMTPGFSRLIITDMVVDNVGAAREMAWEDLNMMTIGGIERTERQWRDLLGDCGFKIHKIWRNSAVEHAVIDARVK
ncbi:S-adenosyl-L-methionine-dependent methyltransferase [Dothidotthia symphoricarpi CBS 119687]|uniref:S-adenosyl-L-methionine-dependent methyltransferase n=1 Tax=Dothidotthia symphoricarpi CBS 119687 TaxID=1392245 RepID=A0A6A5ZWT6_9PLEO|nr:S-adenosyl-L-methionine-dependent methyltransferase [Dothidotthia symphoricarpi CBS 119687]KAF2123485.1 S-adenosyl-L-methionine-dependent methyltransferase [Dothidotthia symphoricarpi CBS 119687]